MVRNRLVLVQRLTLEAVQLLTRSILIVLKQLAVFYILVNMVIRNHLKLFKLVSIMMNSVMPLMMTSLIQQEWFRGQIYHVLVAYI